jgi:hypothetical protein
MRAPLSSSFRKGKWPLIGGKRLYYERGAELSMSDQEDVRRLADLRQWLEERTKQLEDELAMLRQTATLVDEQLKRSSFVKATEVPVAPRPAALPEGEEAAAKEEVKAVVQGETRPLKRQKDGYLLANAYVEPNVVTIVPAADVVLRSTTPPFKTYLIGKVLTGMRDADEEQAKQGKIARDRLISFEYEEDSGRIVKIIVRNYNDRLRLNEILSTTTWTFTKMLEKQA